MNLSKLDYAPFVVYPGLNPTKKFWLFKKAIKYSWDAANKEAIAEKDDKAYMGYIIHVLLFGLHIGTIYLSKKNKRGYLFIWRKLGGLSRQQIRENIIKDNALKNEIPTISPIILEDCLGNTYEINEIQNRDIATKYLIALVKAKEIIIFFIGTKAEYKETMMTATFLTEFCPNTITYFTDEHHIFLYECTKEEQIQLKKQFLEFVEGWESYQAQLN